MKMTRRAFLGAAAGAAAVGNSRLRAEMGGHGNSPAEGANPGFLTVALTWEYPRKPGESQYGAMLLPYAGVILRVSLQENLQDPFIDLRLPEGKTSYRLAVVPDTTCYWAVIPFDKQGEHREASSRHHLRTSKPEIEDVDDDRIRNKNPREGAHWEARKARGASSFQRTSRCLRGTAERVIWEARRQHLFVGVIETGCKTEVASRVKKIGNVLDSPRSQGHPGCLKHCFEDYWEAPGSYWRLTLTSYVARPPELPWKIKSGSCTLENR